MNQSHSVWVCGQRPPRTQRAGRYVEDTTSHPARMLPDLAAHAIDALTLPGQIVLDPMCGAGTTLVEALHLGRHAVGVDVEARWASLARDNIELTRRRGVGGYAHVITADARGLPDVLPTQYREQLTGQVNLVLTSPPYGASTHGQVLARPGAGVLKSDTRYSPRAKLSNLAYLPLHRLLAGLTRILAGCVPLLAPDGYVAITTRPWRQHGELIDLPGAVTHAARHAGLVPVQRCVALLCGIRGEGELVSRASFFQRLAVTRAREQGQPWHLVAHEDLLLFAVPRRSRGSRALTGISPATGERPAQPAAAALRVATHVLAITGHTAGHAATETGAA